ncbi:MAG: hypothetical protein ACI94Y_000642 [Maribacter sp.]|jgi:hypothetical protein
MSNNIRPFFWIKTASYKSSFIFFAILSIIVMIAMKITGIPLETSVSPNGIVDFEFAGDVETAKAMMAGWEIKNPGLGKIYAAYNMGLDNLFLFVYSHAIGLACLLIGKKIEKWKKVAMIIATLQILAALFDIVENYGLVQLIQGSEDEFFAGLAYFCAIPKFVFIILGLLFSFIGLFKKA